MYRYHFLTKQEFYEAHNNLRNAFLAAKNGEEADEIINGLLTDDEKIKLGRRIITASLLQSGMNTRDVVQVARVGLTTVNLVSKKILTNPRCFQLINPRIKKVEKTYRAKKYAYSGGSELVHKKRSYSGFKRRDVKR